MSKELAAYEAFYARTWRKTRAYLRSRVLNDEDIADLLQDIYLKAWRNWRSGKPEEEEANWVRAIARNKLIDYYRVRSRHGEGEDIEEQWGLPGPDGIENWERADLLRDLLAHMEPRNRDVFMLNEVYGYTFAEIAQMAGLTLQNAYWRYRMARQQAQRYRAAHQ